MNGFFLPAVVLFSSFLFLSCASEEHRPLPVVENSGPNLTRFEAEVRAQQISNVNYQVSLDLTQADSFTGTVAVDFNWTQNNNSDLRMDFSEGKVQTARLNGKEIRVAALKQYIILPADKMQSGVNHLIIGFNHKFADDGRGLTRFVDPSDQRVYIHSQFEAYYANRVFPCFDQPDLKATYILNVKVPTKWVVTSSNREKSKVSTNDGFTIWTFPKSMLFSTYLFSIHAGEYKVFQGPSYKIPLRLLVRQSLAEYVDPKEWFSLTIAGFNFYNAYFDFPYPFEKYDQVIAPEFNAGAMENVGNVAFSENYVVRGKKTRAEKRRLASTLLHEMAHMWFGDLVTMKWWNDLWLNESFATYMSKLALLDATEFKESLLNFNGQKSASMLSDELITTHPIEGEVKDIQQANTAFDGISYGKGASVLEQFSFHLSPTNFQKGVRAYIKKFAWKNATRADFVQNLEDASPDNLVWFVKDWQGPWLQTANLNTIRTQFECKDGNISKFILTETAPPAYPTLRPHTFAVALLKKQGSDLVVTYKIRDQFAKLNPKNITEIDYKGTESVYDQTGILTGQPCPDAIYANFEDHGYFKVELDAASVAVFKTSVGSIKDDFLRGLVWNTLWQMVQGGTLSYVEFGKIATLALATEKNETISDSLTTHLISPIHNGSVYSYYFSANQGDSAPFHEFAAELEKVLKQRLHAAPGDQKKDWMQLLIGASDSPAELNDLKAVLRAKNSSYLGTVVDQDTRWGIIKHLSAWGDPESSALIDSEYKRDSSYLGKLNMIAAKAALPDAKEKDYWVQAFKAEKPKFTYTEFARAFSGMFPLKQSPLREQYSAKFFKDLLDLQGNKGSEEQSLFTQLAPFSCQDQASTQINDFLKIHPNLFPEVSKSLAESSDQNQRCEKSLRFSAAK